MPTSLLMQHLHPRQSTRIVIATVVLLLLGGVLQWRTGVVGRGAPRRGKLIGWWFVLLYAGANVALDWVRPGLSPWVVIVAITPGLPPLVGAAWVLRR
ncbi:hypothetical protein [Micromonospora sediminicola]|uniref:hypothetical protein n=1 Tax=Micromonospora sediminicola TaxID=946078 RepID=UPI003788316B